MNNSIKYKVKVARKISEIPISEWDSVFPQALENYRFFKTLDESNFDQFKFFYIVVYDNTKVVGATTCFLMRFSLYMTVKGFLKKFYSAIDRIIPNILTPNILMVGLPMGQGRIGIAQGHDSVLGVINNSLDEIARQEKASLINYKDFTASYDHMLKPLFARGFTKIESLPSTEMDINFSTFDEYMKSLSQSSREGIKRKFRKTDSLVKFDLEITGAPSEAVLPEIYGLYLQTFDKLDMGLEKLTPDFFRIISRNMPDECKYFLWRKDGNLAAFALCLISQDKFVDYYLGFDYSLAHEYNLYIIRFRDLLKWCLDNGIKHYEMGVTSYEPKRRLGFKLLRLYFYMKHRNPFINHFFGFFSHFMKPENFDPVFKEIKKGS